MLTRRALNAYGLLICIVLISIAMYMEIAMDLNPCPLCVMQRVMIIAMGLVFLLALIHHPQGKGRFVYGLLALLFAAGGLGFAGRQIWLQHLPAGQVPACGPDLYFMIQNFPLTETLRTLFVGTGDCAKVVWTFLGMSIPEWSFVCFCGLAVLSVWGMLKSR